MPSLCRSYTRSEVVKALDFDISEIDSAEVAKEVVIAGARLVYRFLRLVGEWHIASSYWKEKKMKGYIFYVNVYIRTELPKIVESVKDYDAETPLEDALESVKRFRGIQSVLYSAFEDYELLY